MKKWKWIFFGVLLIAIVLYIKLKPIVTSKNIEYSFTTVEKGTIEAIVSSTGTLEAINTVEVGTQVSGTIKKIYVDYNDKVKAGQLLAEMDLKLLNTNLVNAEANLAISEAQYNFAKEDFDRDTKLFNSGVISQKDFQTTNYKYNQAISAKKAALAAVNNIKVTIGYAHITSPINGTITERSVEEGQTVAASFATPKMFTIAEDLSKMQILADVDESDIGYIKNKMSVRFTVQTYPEKKFEGFVSQIRLQPIKINNVVNYQVVIDVENKNGWLLPGMTANIEFITNKTTNAILINNSALRFRPNQLMLNQIKTTLLNKATIYLPDSIKSTFTQSINNNDMYTPSTFKKKLPTKIDGCFYQDSNGKLNFMFIEIGIKTGLQSEIKSFLDQKQLNEGDKVINGVKNK
jgi:HlyD family secretion protein